jgi:hypothetical protein
VSTDPDQMTLRELRVLIDEAQLSGAPPEATFSLSTLANRGQMLVSWEEPRGSGKHTGVHLFRKCPCGHADCPDRMEH